MKNWRDEILQLFGEPIPVLSFIADPDGLLLDAAILKELNSKNIELMEYKEPVSFRYIFESRYRIPLSQNKINLTVRVPLNSLDILPFDLITKAQKAVISKSSIFSKLSANVIKTLPNEDLDKLWEVYSEYTGEATEEASIEYILKQVYKLPYASLKDENDLIRFLLAVHYKNIKYPEWVAAKLVASLSKIESIKALPIMDMITQSSVLFEYISKKWSEFINQLSQKGAQVREPLDNIALLDVHSPFMDGEIRRLADNLFTEGFLKPINMTHTTNLPKWVRFGVVMDQFGDDRVRLLERIFRLSEKLTEKLSYKDWLHIAELFADIKLKSLNIKDGNDLEINMNIAELQSQVDRLFHEWIVGNYQSLINMPYLPNPVMLQHIPHFLAHQEHKKTTLIVLDGMSFLQWQQIRECLIQDFSFNEKGVFAWIPTITSVSRQAMFVGEAPAYYAASINTTAKEESHWKIFWENHGILRMYVDYNRVSNYSEMKDIDKYFKPTNKVNSFVIAIIDELVHSAIQGYKGIEAELNIWLQKGYLKELLKVLLKKGYEVYIGSDHGNRECIGIGKIAEGVLAQTKGERIRVYNTKLLRDKAAVKYSSVKWDGPGLPEDYYTLYAKAGEAFVTEKEKVVSHGGMSLEEVVVPFIKILPKAGKGEGI